MSTTSSSKRSSSRTSIILCKDNCYSEFSFDSQLPLGDGWTFVSTNGSTAKPSVLGGSATAALNENIVGRYLGVWGNKKQHETLIIGELPLTNFRGTWYNNCALAVQNLTRQRGYTVQQEKAQTLAYVIYDVLQENKLNTIAIQQLDYIVEELIVKGHGSWIDEKKKTEEKHSVSQINM